MNSAGQIAQLNALRCKMQPVGGEGGNSSRGKSAVILENEMPGMEKKFRKKELTSNMGTRQEELKSKLSKTRNLFYDSFV